MNESIAWVYLLVRWSIAILLLIVALALLFLTWRLRGVFHWKRSIDREIEALRQMAAGRDDAFRAAVDVVYQRCSRQWKAASIDLSRELDILAFIRPIAACFHPDAEHPELSVEIGSLFQFAENLSRHLQEILSRPILSRLRHVRILHLRQAIDRYRILRDNPVVRFSVRHRLWLQRLNHLRLIVLPDPVSWLIRLLNQWIVLRLSRFFLVDITLFIGRQAVLAYGEVQNLPDRQPSLRDIENALEDLKGQEEPVDPLSDKTTRDIRSRLLAGRYYLRPPAWKQWKEAIRDLVEQKARLYFPESVRPTEEALLIVLLRETEALLEMISRSRRIAVLKNLHGIRLASLLRIGKALDAPVGRLSGNLLIRSWDTYQWASIPLMVFRMIQRASPAGIAWQTGWFLLQRSLWYYIGKMAFDAMAIRIDRVYRLSARSDEPL
ncbi:MAG: hypothetical protein AB1547_07280 [Thermodesulfobacteriota bacterium]